jgi:hypothetical protein
MSSTPLGGTAAQTNLMAWGMNDEHHQGGGPEPRGIDAVQQPDHATIARFHDRHRAGLGEVSVQVLRLCAEAGLVRVGLVAVDGTKIDADAIVLPQHDLAGGPRTAAR